MKKIGCLFFLPILFSCGGNSSENEKNTGFLENFSYTIDTVMIDAGEDFIFLQGLNFSSLSPDRNLLYSYNFNDVQLEVIELNELRLKEKIKLDQEGPKGVGNPSIVKISGNGDFFFLGFSGIHQLDPKLENMTSYTLRKQKFGSLDPDETLDFGFSISEDGQTAYVAYGKDDEEQARSGLAVISLKDLRLRKIPVKIWESLQPYVRTFIENGEIQMRTIEPVNKTQIGNRLLLSSGNFNEVYVVDLLTDSVRHITYTSKLTRDMKTLPEKTTANSNQEMREMFQQANREVEFKEFHFDDKSRKFFRFSRDVSRTIVDSVVYKSVLTVFDEELQQIHEEEVPLDIFGFRFFKDGKLWSYVNVEDELGFAVMDFKF
jgi:hypothetical protein